MSEHFECGFSIYQKRDGSFRVYTLDEKGNRTEESEPLEFYANAVCVLASRLFADPPDEEVNDV